MGADEMAANSLHPANPRRGLPTGRTCWPYPAAVRNGAFGAGALLFGWSARGDRRDFDWWTGNLEPEALIRAFAFMGQDYERGFLTRVFTQSDGSDSCRNGVPFSGSLQRRAIMTLLRLQC